MTGRTRTIILAVCLLISVCLNLFAFGAFVAGRWIDRRIETSVNTVMQTYPPSVRRDVTRRLIADRQTVRAAAADLREARQRMFVLMRADPLDRNALDRAMADVREKTEVLQAMLQNALAASLAETPASERQKIRATGFGGGLLERDKP